MDATLKSHNVQTVHQHKSSSLKISSSAAITESFFFFFIIIISIFFHMRHADEPRDFVATRHQQWRYRNLPLRENVSGPGPRTFWRTRLVKTSCDGVQRHSQCEPPCFWSSSPLRIEVMGSNQERRGEKKKKKHPWPEERLVSSGWKLI